MAAAKTGLLTAGTLQVQERGVPPASKLLLLPEDKVEWNPLWGVELLSPGTRIPDVTRRRLWSLVLGAHFFVPVGSWVVHIPLLELLGLPRIGRTSSAWSESGNRVGLWEHPWGFRFSLSLGICFAYIYCRLFLDKDPAGVCGAGHSRWCCPCPLLCKCFFHLFHCDFWTALVLRLKWER